MKLTVQDRMINFTYYKFKNTVDINDDELIQATLKDCIAYHLNKVLKFENILCEVNTSQFNNDSSNNKFSKMTFCIKVIFEIDGKMKYFGGHVEEKEIFIGEFTKEEYEDVFKIIQGGK